MPFSSVSTHFASAKASTRGSASVVTEINVGTGSLKLAAVIL